MPTPFTLPFSGCNTTRCTVDHTGLCRFHFPFLTFPFSTLFFWWQKYNRVCSVEHSFIWSPFSFFFVFWYSPFYSYIFSFPPFLFLFSFFFLFLFRFFLFFVFLSLIFFSFWQVIFPARGAKAPLAPIGETPMTSYNN